MRDICVPGTWDDEGDFGSSVERFVPIFLNVFARDRHVTAEGWFTARRRGTSHRPSLRRLDVVVKVLDAHQYFCCLI